MKTSEIIYQIATEIETELNKQSLPGPNATIPKRIRFIAAELSGRDHYAAEKAAELALLADTFYSARKHWKYPGGYEKLWADMTIDLLHRIRKQASLWSEKGD